MATRIALCLSLFLFATGGYAQTGTKDLRLAYREKYRDMAIHQMKLHGVPASITLAQGMLESGNGKSRLATQGNNHFGIKCHKGWKGRRMYHDDDSKGECFRVYSTPEQSFEDHSLFLRGTKRYADLFKLDPTDYKGWAKGLSAAGYATDPNYAKRLIAIIEEENLAPYDTGVEVTVEAPTVEKEVAVKSPDSYVIRMDGDHEVYEKNRVKYVVVKHHDTYASLTKTLEMMDWELQKYNELDARYLPKPGTVLYIQPKRRSAQRNNVVHVVEEGETMYTIAQKYAMKLKWLYKRNHMKPPEEPEVGQLLYLRGKAPQQ